MNHGFRAALTSFRLLVGLLDLAVEVVLGAALVWWWLPAEEWPPRYWNLFDYAVDVACHHTDLAVRSVSAFAVVFVVWEVFWGKVIGNAPIARMAGMQVVTSRGRRPGTIRLAFRAVLALVGGAFAFAGPLLAIVSPSRRMLHDMMSSCHVVSGAAPAGADSPPDEFDTVVLRDRYRDGPFR